MNQSPKSPTALLLERLMIGMSGSDSINVKETRLTSSVVFSTPTDPKAIGRILGRRDEFGINPGLSALKLLLALMMKDELVKLFTAPG